jgi:hypothetical protein
MRRGAGDATVRASVSSARDSPEKGRRDVSEAGQTTQQKGNPASASELLAGEEAVEVIAALQASWRGTKGIVDLVACFVGDGSSASVQKKAAAGSPAPATARYFLSSGR